MKRAVGVMMVAATTAAVVAWWIMDAIRQFEHVADLGDLEWFDDVFDGYDWGDDDYWYN